jgi:hypothetical protein
MWASLNARLNENCEYLEHKNTPVFTFSSGEKEENLQKRINILTDILRDCINIR